jgi:hypothetical protein
MALLVNSDSIGELLSTTWTGPYWTSSSPTFKVWTSPTITSAGASITWEAPPISRDAMKKIVDELVKKKYPDYQPEG